MGRDEELRALERAAHSGDRLARIQWHLGVLRVWPELLPEHVRLEAELKALLRQANLGRRARCLELVDIARLVFDVSETRRSAWKRGAGRRAIHPGIATVVLVVPDGDELTIGVRHGRARELTPDRVWRELCPWKPDSSEGQERLLVWARPPVSTRVREGAIAIDITDDRVRIEGILAERWAVSLLAANNSL